MFSHHKNVKPDFDADPDEMDEIEKELSKFDWKAAAQKNQNSTDRLIKANYDAQQALNKLKIAQAENAKSTPAPGKKR